MNVPLLDLTRQYDQIRDRLTPRLTALLESQQFILGEPVRQFEAEMADYCGVPFAVGVSSGTDALLISLMAIGTRPGDLVITSPYTFFATAGAIARLGAIPLFVDIEPRTFTIDPAKLAHTIDDLKPSDRERLKAIIPVHLYGQCADMGPITEIARTFHLSIIEDAAQAIGAEYGGKRAGSMGDYGCFSFFPSKNLGGFGDGGLVSAQSESDRDHLVRLRVHGGAERYRHTEIGGNFRLDALQALVLSVKLAYLDQWTAMRRDNAARYRMLFADAGLQEHVGLPIEVNGKHVYNQFVIRAPRHRDALQRHLAENGIGVAIYYPIPLHLQPCFAYLGQQAGDFPQSERAAGETLALPIFPELEPAQMERVVDIIASYFRRHT
ncbi:DegT/DnrJ/EryC1/StrS family aminotransferase [Desulfatirhabdium butyrativorans]|uniref:DegT/DnrJ/EryC1/StrS family aminotransferase n=1 Tax=Desulfatirhabdium butyrativorans TaxID=340467 RepID=UPI0003F8CA58|nr:DegT/DnrJ/EryC1/StrS family aminotransferase [Desulfatirhabdium butyrativorans]